MSEHKIKDFIFWIMIIALVLLVIGLVTPGYGAYPFLFSSLGLTVIGWVLAKRFHKVNR